jgi:hypothetical protein
MSKNGGGSEKPRLPDPKPNPQAGRYEDKGGRKDGERR